MFLTSNLYSFSAKTVKAAAVKNKTIELNLVNGISSDNLGLKVSSANLAGEVKSKLSVIPLMKMFRIEKNNKARTAAALSLLKIGDARGIKVIEYASRFDDDSYVKSMCKMFYSYYLLTNS